MTSGLSGIVWKAGTPVLMLAILGFTALPAEAHRPYFTQSESTVLADGSEVEMRIIAGDGIIFADPKRILILNDDGRLLARGPAGGFPNIVCDFSGHCVGYDDGMIVEPDLTTFRRNGPVVPAMGERDALWEIEAGDESWGVIERQATIWENLLYELQLLTRGPTVLFFLTGGALALCLTSIRAPTRGRRGYHIFWIAVFVVRSVVTTIIIGFSIYLSALIAPTIGQSTGAFLAGLSIALLAIWKLETRVKKFA